MKIIIDKAGYFNILGEPAGFVFDISFMDALPENETIEIIDERKTRKRKNPVWCKYPDVENDFENCWPLVKYPKDIDREFCKDCKYYKRRGEK